MFHLVNKHIQDWISRMCMSTHMAGSIWHFPKFHICEYGDLHCKVYVIDISFDVSFRNILVIPIENLREILYIVVFRQIQYSLVIKLSFEHQWKGTQNESEIMYAHGPIGWLWIYSVWVGETLGQAI